MNPSPDHILQTGMAFWASKTLLSAVDIGVFTELAKHPGDLHAVSGRLGLHPRAGSAWTMAARPLRRPAGYEGQAKQPRTKNEVQNTTIPLGHEGGTRVELFLAGDHKFGEIRCRDLDHVIARLAELEDK